MELYAQVARVDAGRQVGIGECFEESPDGLGRRGLEGRGGAGRDGGRSGHDQCRGGKKDGKIFHNRSKLGISPEKSYICSTKTCTYV